VNAPPADDRAAEVDALRQRLRALGYLDAGVDRFVLAPAHSRRGSAAIALLASLRIGALGGLLLGPAAAIGVALQLPSLVTSVRDAAVIALYMALLFAAGIAAAALTAGLIVTLVARRTGASLARRGRLIATAAGAAVALASLSYLTLLWTAVRGATAVGHPVLWAASGLAVAVAVSLLLGHAVALTALALIVAGTRTPLRTPGVPGASWRVMIGLGIAAFAAAVVLFNAGGIGAHAGGAAPPPLTVVSSGARVRLIAVDGFDPAVFATLAAAGRLPALSKALAGAEVRLSLPDEDRAGTGRADPARLWTTIATGQPAAVHGVRSLETRQVAGLTGILHAGDDSRAGRLLGLSTDLLRLTRPSVASRRERQEKTFWEVAADAGLRTVVVNWWATWPALSTNAVVLSDRATLRLERGGALDAEIAPAALYQALAARWPDLRARAGTSAAAALSGVHEEPGVTAILRRSAELDALTLVLLGEVTTSRDDLRVVYLPGLDIAQHALAAGADRAGAAGPEALASYYSVLDVLLADAIEAAPDEIVMIVTTPGRADGDPGGRLAIRGGMIASGAKGVAGATDVAATVLYALGLPISQRLSGAPLVSLFGESFARRHPVRYVSTYGPPAAADAAASGQPLDQEMIDRLRSLGYVR
jgi:hypothetical protein